MQNARNANAWQIQKLTGAQHQSSIKKTPNHPHLLLVRLINSIIKIFI